MTDRRHTFFKDPRAVETFTGVGQVLGGDTKPSRLVQSNLNKATHKVEQPHTDVTSELPGNFRIRLRQII